MSNKTKKLRELLKDTELEDVTNFYECDFKSADEAIEYIQERISEEEIIYSYKAIEYLSEHDQSLQYSLELAHDMGYEAKSLNSEILATILYQQNLSEQLEKYRDKIEELFEEEIKQ